MDVFFGLVFIYLSVKVTVSLSTKINSWKMNQFPSGPLGWFIFWGCICFLGRVYVFTKCSDLLGFDDFPKN